MRRSIDLYNPMALRLSIIGSICTGRSSLRVNAMRFIHPPEDPVPSLIILMSFGKPCTVIPVSRITEHRQLSVAGATVLSAAWPLLNGRDVSPTERSHRIPPVIHGFQLTSPGRKRPVSLSDVNQTLSSPTLHSCPKERQSLRLSPLSYTFN
jgi:hypothetical protein